MAGTFMSGVAVQFALDLACDLAEVRRAATLVRQFFAEQHLNDADAIDCELALVEAVTNAIRYAVNEGRSLPVQVRVTCMPDQVELSVTDHTPGFDWPEHVALPSTESERGRGLFIIQSVMNSTE